MSGAPLPRITSVTHGRAYAYRNAVQAVADSPLPKILSNLNNLPNGLTLEELREAWAAFDGCRRALEGK